MEKGKKKPLRSTGDKLKDIYDTYLKNEEERVIPINESDSDKDFEEKLNEEDTPESKEELKEEQKEELKKEEEIEEKAEEEIDDDEVLLEIQELIRERDELREKLIRNSAEMENLRKRTAREKSEIVEYANEKLLFKMLDMLDDMDKAIEAGKESKNQDALLQGVEMIRKKIIKIFEEEGVKRMENPEGKEFNVDFHDAMMQMKSDIPEGHVVQEVQPGYMYGDKVLRHAKVVTSAGNESE